MSKPAAHVVVIGGGFAGINATKELLRRGPSDLRVTLIDRRNHHLFQPLLYQVAMAGLSPADIATPIRAIFKGERRVNVRLGTVTGIDLEERRVRANDEEIPYDYLLIATGATHDYFGNDHWEERAPGLKTLEHATEIRRRVLTAFERAEIEENPRERRRLLTFIVVGGGPTGVELAGALGELSRHTLVRDFRNIDSSATRVLLIEGGDRILTSFDADLSDAAVRDLEKLGVSVWTNTLVTNVDADGVQAGEERVRAATVLWAAGVRASELGRCLGVELDGAGRVPIDTDLSVIGLRNVFVVGDLSRFEVDGEPLPGVAPVAVQQGIVAARNIIADLNGEGRESFVYRDKGMMATIGRAAAVMQSGPIKWTGFGAWLAWCFVHILYLVGFRNRVLVFVQWLWSYVKYRRGARLITEPNWRVPSLELSCRPAAHSDSPAAASGDVWPNSKTHGPTCPRRLGDAPLG